MYVIKHRGKSYTRTQNCAIRENVSPSLLCPLTVGGKEVGCERSPGQQERAHVLANQMGADSISRDD